MLKSPFRFIVALAALAVALPASAQNQKRSVVADLVSDMETAEQKVVGLAEAIPESKYGWRPGEGVRSVAEVVMHIAADNYLLAALGGSPAPAATGIKGDDYQTAVAYEKKVPAKAEAIAALKASFAHVRKAMAETPESRLGESVSMFGQQATVQSLWILTTTHLHEHLGQLIAYARTNDVVPPWSRGN
jgi:uncharacterized damage-inducible protein DinB